MDASEDLPMRNFQSFFLGGGPKPASILTGFDPQTLATAFNVSKGEVEEILSREREGPIVHMSDSHRPSVWSKFMDLEEQDRLKHLQRVVRENGGEDEDEPIKWSWRKLLDSVLGRRRPESGDEWGLHHAPDSCNLYDRSPDFRNDYGWSIALDESDYKPLRHSGIGIYLVNLSAGSMMAPHVNPTATEYGIVLSGSGTVQIGYPNGSSAMNAKVKEGDVFWIPRYFPFCQISSKSGPLEFFGFTTSARRNRPQFLAGRNSVLRAMGGPELATSFGVSDKRLEGLLRAQRESVILPSPEAAGHLEKGFDGDLITDF
ncbi:vicilin-like seed storage protein At2g28490 [Syzygium oleosum]|uniref:vicilin-like seed storage protein At2g28490 n=1 Tax=Syzygium oleosum TaxID=219896 RepID=UPI0024B89716|nr:vicilin-like seed storage protein At2g28490 [Syzygium oleosum]